MFLRHKNFLRHFLRVHYFWAVLYTTTFLSKSLTAKNRTSLTAKKFLRFLHATAKKFLRLPGFSASDPQLAARSCPACGRKKKFLRVHYFWAVLYARSLAFIMRCKVLLCGLGYSTISAIVYRYVWQQKVWFFTHIGLKHGIDFNHFDLKSVNGYGFHRNGYGFAWK